MISLFEKSGLSWIVTFTGAAGIFCISSLEFGGGASFGLLSFIYHFSSFFCFSFFLFISSVKGKKNNFVFFFAIFLAFMYAVLDELHQFFVPGRSSSFVDIGVDSLGILFSSMIYFIRMKVKNTKL